MVTPNTNPPKNPDLPHPNRHSPIAIRQSPIAILRWLGWTDHRHRLSIARALYDDPELLIMDDPLAAVDASVCGRIFDRAVLARVARGKSVVLALNQLQLLPRCDVVVCLEAGTVAYVGPYHSLPPFDWLNLKSFVHNKGDDQRGGVASATAATASHGADGADGADSSSDGRSTLANGESDSGGDVGGTVATKLNAADAAIKETVALVTEESGQTGRVGMHVLAAYISSIGTCFFTSTACVTLASYVVMVLTVR
jgi:energy-coupling factor transporter ATP-binding protein EcfA2